MKKILIIGSGFGAVYTYRTLHRSFHNSKDVSVTILSKTNYFLFSPMLHEVATGGLSQSDIIQPIRKILYCCLHSFVECTVTGIDANTKTVSSTAGDFSYDYLVIAVGSQSAFFDVPGAEKYALPLKTIHDAITIRSRLLELLEQSMTAKDEQEKKWLLRWIVIGGGPTGVELAGELVELAESFAKAAPPGTIFPLDTQIHHSDKNLLAMCSPKIQAIAADILRKKGVSIHVNSRIKEVLPDGVITENGETISAGVVLWSAGVQPVHFNIIPSGIFNEKNRIPVSSFLNVERYPEIFVVGDIAYLPMTPQTAQAAVREAKVAGQNIVAAMRGNALKQFHYHELGFLVSLGQWRAVGNIMGVTIHGRFTWWLWRTVYLFKLIGLPNKIRVAVDWTLNLFFPRDISQI